jgi:hypothetical protein
MILGAGAPLPEIRGYEPPVSIQLGHVCARGSSALAKYLSEAELKAGQPRRLYFVDPIVN